jgi:outer membrane receptor protein involved in Fe transport
VNLVDHGSVGGSLEGMINMPLAEYAALRVSGFFQRDAGFIDNVPGCRAFLPAPVGDCSSPVGITVENDAFVEKDQNVVDSWGGRAAMKIDLDEVWTVTPQFMYQEMRSKGRYSYDPSVGDLQVQRFDADWRNERFSQAALTIEGQLGNWDITYAGAYMDRTTASMTDYTDYSEAYDAYYASVGGLAGYFYYQDAAGNTIDPRQNVEGSDHFKKFSQEFRVSSPQSERLRLTAGLFYQRQSNFIHQDYLIDGLAPELSVNGRAGTLWLTQQERVDKDYAVFGEASFDILPNLTLTAGGRGFIFDNSLIGFFGFGRNPGGNYTDGPFNAAGSSRTGVIRCFATDGLRLRGYEPEPDSATRELIPGVVDGTPCTNLGQFLPSQGIVPVKASGQGFTHKLNLTWKPTEDILLYGTWSRGFRPGGINRRADVPAYDPDYLTNYEIGWKTTWLDGMLRLNGAIYQQEWDTFQFSFLGPNSFTIILNGPNARIRGIEMDAGINTGGLALNVSGSYTDAKTLNNLCSVADPTFTCAGSDITAPAGTRLPITPQFKINGTARYTFDLAPGVSGYGQAVAAHQSGASADVRVADAATVGYLPGYETVSLSAGAELETYTLEIFVSNLFDERGQLSRFVACGLCSRPYIVPIQPRTFGIRAGAKF